jgi:hypothetical protein
MWGSGGIAPRILTLSLDGGDEPTNRAHSSGECRDTDLRIAYYSL